MKINIELIKTAIGELGNTEYPMNSNKQKYGEWYGMNGVPYCAIFVSWVFNQTGIPLGIIDTDKGFHYTPSALNHFKKTEELTKNPKTGDIVFFDWQGDGKVDHVGIFLQDNHDKITFMTIEGNTALGNDSNGGEVMIKVRKYKQAVFVHPKVLNLEIFDIKRDI